MTTAPLFGGKWDANALSDTSFTIGETTFSVYKLLPHDAFTLLDMIRVSTMRNAVGVLPNIAIGGQNAREVFEQGFMAFLLMLLSMPSDDLLRVRDVLWRNVEFTNHMAQSPMSLESNHEMAFDRLEGIHYYEVLVRCLVVNFTESWDAIQSLMT